MPPKWHCFGGAHLRLMEPHAGPHHPLVHERHSRHASARLTKPQARRRRIDVHASKLLRIKCQPLLLRVLKLLLVLLVLLLSQLACLHKLGVKRGHGGRRQGSRPLCLHGQGVAGLAKAQLM